MKVSEATPLQIDYLVAKCEGITEGKDKAWYYDRRDAYTYSTDWAQAGPIIEREEISVSREFASGQIEWAAWTPAPIRDDAEAFGYGPTPLIAAMRCYVASKLGDEVDVPKELL